MNDVSWLLDSEPAIRWQALRDLTNASPSEVATARARVPREGLGARILACQASDGAWHRADSPDWLPTLFTLLLLRSTGAEHTDPAVASALTRLEVGFRWDEEFGKEAVLRGGGGAVHQR